MSSPTPEARVDLRSDTVTQPTPAMREAMAQAVVGDDVLGDDPPVSALEDRVAELLGKEAALLVPSGTMSNAVAVRAHTQPGDEIVAEATSHIYVYEGGGFAALSGCSIALVHGPASGRMAVGEAITNIAASRIEALGKDVRRWVCKGARKKLPDEIERARSGEAPAR